MQRRRADHVSGAVGVFGDRRDRVHARGEHSSGNSGRAGERAHRFVYPAEPRRKGTAGAPPGREGAGLR